jgi:hypothetical protein
MEELGYSANLKAPSGWRTRRQSMVQVIVEGSLLENVLLLGESSLLF